MKELFQTLIVCLSIYGVLSAIIYLAPLNPDHVDLKVACDKVKTAGAGAVVWQCEDAQGVFYYTKSGNLVHSKEAPH